MLCPEATGWSTSRPVRPPPVSSSVPATPPVTICNEPVTRVPETLSAAIWIVALPPAGSRIAPPPLNGPSIDAPSAVQVKPPLFGSRLSVTSRSPADGSGLSSRSATRGRASGPSIVARNAP